jgi:hypothetical protein
MRRGPRSDSDVGQSIHESPCQARNTGGLGFNPNDRFFQTISSCIESPTFVGAMNCLGEMSSTRCQPPGFLARNGTAAQRLVNFSDEISERSLRRRVETMRLAQQFRDYSQRGVRLS